MQFGISLNAGLVGGVNLTHALQLYSELKSYVDNLENSEEVIINEPLELGSKIAGHLWSELMEDVVFADEGPNIHFSGNKTFEQRVMVQNTLSMQHVNGMILQRDFLLRSGGQQTIRGKLSLV